MTNTKANILLLVAAAGAAASVAPTSSASQNAAAPHVINMSGATLLENFARSPASTNDFIDVDGDGIAGSLGTGVEQLAPLRPDAAWTGSSWLPSQYWIFQYRVAGSVRGFQELVNYGRTPGIRTVPASSQPAGQETNLGAGTVNKIYSNRELAADGAACRTPPASIANLGNPGCLPCRSAGLPDGTLVAPFTVTSSATPYTVNATPQTGGVRIDIAVSDVPGVWAFVANGTSNDGNFNDLPTQLGYGRNGRLSTNTQGVPFTTGTTGNNQLAVLTGGANLFTPGNPVNADTIFDTELLWAPIALVTSLGTGIRELDASAVRHLFTTGRLPNGENLIVVTRDSGSGTRNGFNNTLCHDPSWGNGDNVGVVPSNPNDQHTAGATFVPSNKGGNAAVERTLINNRISVGYVGVERGLTADGTNPGGEWLSGSKLELIAIRDDLRTPAQTLFYRPTIANILNGNYLVGGPSVVATFGDPRAASTAKGGDNNGNPQVPNVQAAAYINNITRSIAEFISVPGGDETIFSPAERIATQFVLTGALSKVPDRFDPCAKVANPAFNSTLSTFTLNDPNNILGPIRGPGLSSFGFYTLNGINPARVSGAGIVYSDSSFNPSTNGNAAYVTQGTTGRNGVTLAYNSPANSRNRIGGDFSGNGIRDINDITEMLKAWQDRNGGAFWIAPNGTGAIAGASGADACVEILGDFNSDGSFDAKDVRYFADGLAMVGGVLNRKDGFTAVDTAFAGLPGGDNNFFNTTLANPSATYTPGDARGDIANASGRTTPGWAPIGADRNNNAADADDNRIDAADIDYVYDQFKTNPRVTDGALNWNNTQEAVNGDLSADINGDLIVNQADVCELVTQILETNFRDVNLDGVGGTAADIAIVNANLGLPGGWAQGDVNGDGTVTAADLAIVSGTGVDPCAPPCACPRNRGDANGDCLTNGADLSVLLGQFNQNVPTNSGGDFNGDGQVNGADLSILLGNFNCQ